MIGEPAYQYDAVVVGSGPNGLAAAILMQQQGLSVLMLEGKDTIGGGLRTAELTLPGFKHDICSAIHPMAIASPFFKTLPLDQFGLEYLYPEVDAAHPMDGSPAAVLMRSINSTADGLGADGQVYKDLIEPIIDAWPNIAGDALGPIAFPKHPLHMAKFGLKAIQPATWLAKSFNTEKAKALLAGMAAHAIQPLTNWATSAIALVLMANAHIKGWPAPKGGSQQIANALAGYFLSLGGKIETNTYITSLHKLPAAKAYLFDITPDQLMQIAGERLSALYTAQLKRYKYGMGVFKLDWALREPIPFKDDDCRKAGTLHLGGTFKEIAAAEQRTSNGHHPEKPFVILAQPTVFDPTRASAGKHVAWGYCHVPNGSVKDMTEAIENQIERFAPGFRDTIIGRHIFNTQQLQLYNPNYIGGDINGGLLDITQLFTRPVLKASPYRTSIKNIYLCSSSTPPGGGVHGMCGYHAAKRALKEIFNITANRNDISN
ncbi:NAD(P)/FAD-dependent oxidoreductase [Mucilaginibacter pallidiroseus]|uniref:NAD(P)/FAD-dependent oxidoreductase n=1 Tax=Mucilaginibacter pallidiroseus TaxID=2599295 RepID=A0A563U244_9SPHI|nr:NAD(P)/FAD-dependent oxidoreductase [Mucilaginibacter pallidiroseus]TWR24729.1 NAD(P)/FAD-dependent oxidoreductase [Mucilaginibacter pallidiroseus]